MVKKSSNELTLAGHVRELKMRILKSVITFIVGFAVCYIKAPDIVSRMMQMGETAGFTFIYISPQELLIQSLRVAGTAGLILSSPVILWEIAAFLAPVFDTSKSRRILYLCTVISYLLFFCGIVFCGKILFPFIYEYLYEYSAAFRVSACVSVKEYLTLLLTVMWVLGFIFEFPLICAGLSACGMLTPGMMRKWFRPALVVIAVVSALVTPPDVISMFMVMIPTTLIYVAGIAVSRLFTLTKKQREE